MKPESYKAMAETVKTMPLMEKNIIISGKIITTLVYLLYPAFLVFLFVNKNPGGTSAIARKNLALGPAHAEFNLRDIACR